MTLELPAPTMYCNDPKVPLLTHALKVQVLGSEEELAGVLLK
jgi:hypothetical protein